MLESAQKVQLFVVRQNELQWTSQFICFCFQELCIWPRWSGADWKPLSESLSKRKKRSSAMQMAMHSICKMFATFTCLESSKLILCDCRFRETTNASIPTPTHKSNHCNDDIGKAVLVICWRRQNIGTVVEKSRDRGMEDADCAKQCRKSFDKAPRFSGADLAEPAISHPPAPVASARCVDVLHQGFGTAQQLHLAGMHEQKPSCLAQHAAGRACTDTMRCRGGSNQGMTNGWQMLL